MNYLLFLKELFYQFISSFIQKILSKYLTNGQGIVLSVGGIAVNKTKLYPHRSDIGEQINISINI